MPASATSLLPAFSSWHIIVAVTQRLESGGAKTLLLVRNLPNMVFNASACGDNCARWLLKIGKEQDVLVTLYHIMKFPWKHFEIRIDNDGRIVKNMQEFVGATNDFLDVDE